jgi:hypothetical protein
MRFFAGRRHEGLSARVGRGAALLDAESPGWESRIDLERLDVAYSDTCPLGLLYGDFGRGVTDLFIWDWQATGHGFQAGRLSRLVGSEGRDNRSLTSLWAAEVRTRRGKAVAGRVVVPPGAAAGPVLV